MMTKEAITGALSEQYRLFVNYIGGLSEEDYTYSFQGKWTAAQQLEHLVLCVKPLVQVFSMDKAAIEKNFGSTGRKNLGYDELLSSYIIKLDEGGKAPSRFVPEATIMIQREALCENLSMLVKELCLEIDTFTDQELDSLQIPHPLLGNLTLREMLYNAIYHVGHHQQLTKQNLAQA